VCVCLFVCNVAKHTSWCKVLYALRDVVVLLSDQRFVAGLGVRTIPFGVGFTDGLMSFPQHNLDQMVSLIFNNIQYDHAYFPFRVAKTNKNSGSAGFRSK
jgi:hypothetical protein